MAQGLDELIEWLIGEVAFYGEGCAVSDIFASVRKYGKDDEVVEDDKPETGGNNVAALQAAAKAPLTDAELRLGRLIWSHIVDTGDVSVGPGGKWNHLTFDELISLPEEAAQGSGAAIEDITVRLGDKQPEQLHQPEQPVTESPQEDRRTPKIRPRLFVSEETVWKTLTGHGIDYRRVPLMEWRLMVAIGSTKESGIAQPDLVKLTGQDKRSVPRRTDFLAMKGYIVKRTHMIRGMKTSKLWLVRFAPDLPTPTNALKGLDVSKAILTKDMEPVPWVHQWVGNKNAKGKEELAYTALVQTIVAVIKAWGTLRLRDLKKKLGIIGLRWQMKIVSKFLRRANWHGNLGYTAAQFIGNNVIFKDCIKFIREPTEDDWRVLLATGARSRPDWKQGSRRNRRKKKGNVGRPRKNQAAAKPKVRVLQKRLRLPPSPAVVQWDPEKPIVNTLAEYVLTGGKEGYTATEASIALVGTEFRRYLHRHMSNMCQSYIQPPGLAEYQMTSELTRSGSVKAYVFRCAGAPQSDPEQAAIDPSLAQQSGDNELNINDFGFEAIDPSAFVGDDSMDMASLVKLAPAKIAKPKRAQNRPGDGTPSKPKKGRPTRKHKTQDADAPSADAPNSDAQTTGAPNVDVPQVDPPKAVPVRRKRKAAKKVSYVDDLDELIDGIVTDSDGELKLTASAPEKPGYQELLEEAEQSDAESVKSLKTVVTEESEKTPDRTLPGVYVGKPGSLNPDPRKKGRPRKSLVLIFRSDKLKDPNFLPGRSDYPKPRDVSAASPQQPAPIRKTPTSPKSSRANTPTPVQPEEQVPVVEPGPSANALQVSDQPVGQCAEDPILLQRPTAKHAGQVAAAEPFFALSTPDQVPEVGSSSIAVETLAEGAIVDSAPKVVESPQPKKKLQAIEPNEHGKYICQTCGGSWANDNGLKYHLTKGKNMCNAYYAENPERMTKSRWDPKWRFGSSSESAALSSRASSASAPSVSSEGSLASERPPSPEPAMAKKRKPPKTKKKKDRPAPAVLEPAEPAVPAKPRPVLKPRSMPKNGRLGGSGIVPRGVLASEAAAKRIAAANNVEKPQDAAGLSGAVVGKVVVGQQNGTEYWEPGEELPYLKHIHAKSAKPSKRKTSEKASQRSSEQSHDHQAFEVQYAGAAFSDEDSPPRFPESPGAPVSDYPAELLDPALRTVTAAADITPAPPATATATNRTMSPGAHTTSSSGPGVNAPVQAHQQVGSVQRLPPSIRMPISKYLDKKGDYYGTAAEKQLLPFRIQEIIQYLVTANGGAFPKDRKALHWAVLKVFRATFESTLLPTHAGTARAVNALEREKVLRMASVAIQPRGTWKQYDIVYLPEIRIKEDVGVTHLKMKAEALDPEMYIPEPFAPTEDEKIYFSSLERPMKERGKGPGRRDHKLDGEIATLNAPFYKQKGLAGVRPNAGRRRIESESEDDGRPRKRRRHARTHADGLAIKRKWKDGEDGERPIKRRRGRKRLNDEDGFVMIEPSKRSIGGKFPANPGLSTLPASFFSRTAPGEINFFPPNTQLEDDYVPSTPSEASVHEEEVTEIEEPTVPAGTCAETFELKANSRGAWPRLPLTWFERNSSSFTMKGWLPTQTDRLIANLPKTSADMAFKITSHCKTDQWADPAYGVFLTSVDGCKSWELSDKGKHFMSGTIAPDYVFMNFSSTKERSSMAPVVDLEWLDQNEWTLETIPYEQLEDNDTDPYLQYDISSLKGPKRGPGRPPKPKAPKKRKYVRKERDPTVREHKLQRELTPYPTKKEDYFRAEEEQSLGMDWKAEDTRIAAYVAVSTLTGGLNKAMDWGLMMRLFPEAKLSNLRKFWSMIKKEREAFIHNLAEKFQEEFLGAYESGELGTFDFDDAVNYDWLKLVKWTLALVVREGVDLPTTRVRFEDELELLLVDKNDFDWRETYHHWQRSVFNKFQDATSEAASIVLKPTRKGGGHNKVQASLASKVTTVPRKGIDNDSVTARSWVRALCCTNPEMYGPVKIRDKFKTLVVQGQRTEEQVSDLLEATILDLEHRRISLKAKSKALQYGRPYRLNDHFSRTLDRYANELKFLVAADFKLKMDRAFKRGEPVEFPWRTEDGMVVAVFNLQAAGRVRIEPTPATKLNIPFGFKPGFYESRKFPKSHYRFGLQVVPTDRYMYNEDIDILHRATQPANIPAATADGKLPMWCDFFGTPHRGRWFKMLAGVLFAYATRGAMGDEYMTAALKPCYEQFEIESVRKWGLEQGLLCELTGPGSDASVTEWWWLVLGQPMLEMAAEEEQDAVVEGEAAGELSAVEAPTAGEGEVEGEGDGSALAAQGDGRRTRDQYEEVGSGRGRRHGKYRVL